MTNLSCFVFSVASVRSVVKTPFKDQVCLDS